MKRKRPHKVAPKPIYIEVVSYYGRKPNGKKYRTRTRIERRRYGKQWRHK